MEADTEQEQNDIDKIDEDDFRDQAISAMTQLCLTEDEAEMQFEDMYGY
jgi:hypothetical protein